jgi:hypothetical protein
MMIRTLNRLVKLSAIAVALTIGLSACGSGGGGNNNQGLSFTLIGFFEEGTDRESCFDGVAVSKFTIGYSTNAVEGTDPFFGQSIVAIGLLNNLAGQLISVDRVNFEFYIPGSSVQPPSTMTVIPVTLGPGPSEIDTSLPTGLEEAPNCSVVELDAFPQAVRAWMSFNRNSLPEAPYEVIVTVNAEGQASGGNRLTTNQESIVVTISPDTLIPGTGVGAVVDEE